MDVDGISDKLPLGETYMYSRACEASAPLQFFDRGRPDHVEVVGDAELRPNSVGAAWGFAAPEQTKGASEGSFECSMRLFAGWQGWRAGACRAAWVKRVRVM